jgi:hypothetical protein
MIEWKFILDESTTNMEVPEPDGWADLQLTIKRDETWHGIFFDFASTTMTWDGEAAQYIQQRRQQDGLLTKLVVSVYFRCNEEEPFELFYRGRINFGKYSELCGNECSVTVLVEEENCTMVLRNRFDTPVDPEAPKAFDGITVVPNYPRNGFTLTLKPVRRTLRSRAEVIDGDYEQDFLPLGVIAWYDGPHADLLLGWTTSPVTSLQEFTMSAQPFVFKGNNAGAGNPATDLTSMLELVQGQNFDCSYDHVDISYRVKGEIELRTSKGLTTFGQTGSTITARIYKLPAGLDPLVTGNWQVLQEMPVTVFPSAPEGTRTNSFDVAGTFTDNAPATGDRYYFTFKMVNSFSVEGVSPVFGTVISGLVITTTDDSFIEFVAPTVCEATTTKAFAIHELISRTTELITDGCLRGRSEYYGRTDSEPYAADADGCGGLRVLFNGLNLRNAPDAKFFVTARNIFSGLNAIDNIGIGIEPAPIGNGLVLRWEPVQYFYQNDELLILQAVPSAKTEVIENKHYATVDAGYKIWQTEDTAGLDEVHSPRQYRTGVDTVPHKLDISCIFIAGSYLIEQTRLLTFAETGAADTAMDAEIFILCLERNGAELEVEQGNVTNATGLFDPSSILNARISPIRNLLRWFKSIINTYQNVQNAMARLYFASGEGNYTACYFLADADCRLEKTTICENHLLHTTVFNDLDDALPIWRNETVKLEYPFSVADYKLVKANPYGYIRIDCGGQTIRGYIREINYRPAQGIADITLIKKY